MNGHGCYTLTAKVLGQKVKIWVDKSTYLIWQSQITLGGAISDEDIDDAASLVAAAVGVTNLPPTELEMAKTQIKLYTPAVTKISGVITSTTKTLELTRHFRPGFHLSRARGCPVDTLAGKRRSRRPRLAPLHGAGLRRCKTPASTTSARSTRRNRSGPWKRRKRMVPRSRQQILRLTFLQKNARLSAGGKYTIGKVGEKPTCSVPGHELP